MATDPIFNIGFSLRQGQTMRLVLDGTYPDVPQPGTVTFTLLLASGVMDARFIADVNLLTPSIALPSVASALSLRVPHGPLLVCLTACAGGALIKPLIECCDRDVQQYIACLKSKGLSIASEVAACAVECVVKHSP